MFTLRRTLVLACTCGILACDTIAGPEVSPSFTVAGNRVVQSATGSGHVTLFDGSLRAFTIHAVKHDDGSVTGETQIINRAVNIREHISIDCFLIDDNIAAMSGVVTISNNPAAVGVGRVWAVQDNGEGAKAPSDRITFVSGAPADPNLCVNVGDRSGFLIFPIEAGNIQVRD